MHTVAMFALLIATTACTKSSIEIPVRQIELAAPLNDPQAQISGMTWCQGKLLLLPQYPGFEDIGNPTNTPVGNLYMLEEGQIEDYLDGKHTEPLQATPVPLIERGIRNQVYEFEGFEAIACEGSQLWLSMETINEQGDFVAHVASGRVELLQQPIEVVLEPKSVFSSVSQSGRKNAGDEALLVHQGNLISLHEVNTRKHVASATATRYSPADDAKQRIEFPPLAYRLTDVTSVDKQGQFWGVNYQWKGDEHLQDDDLLFAHVERGRSHRQIKHTVERLIEFKLENDRVVLSGAEPIQLQLDKREGRNWEGIVRYKDQGFLIVTDQHPETILGFVPYSRNNSGK